MAFKIETNGMVVHCDTFDEMKQFLGTRGDPLEELKQQYKNTITTLEQRVESYKFDLEDALQRLERCGATVVMGPGGGYSVTMPRGAAPLDDRPVRDAPHLVPVAVAKLARKPLRLRGRQQKWSNDQAIKVYQMRLGGYGTSHVAREIGCPPGSVVTLECRGKRLAESLRLRNDEPPAQTFPHHAQRHGDDVALKIHQLLSDGLPVSVVAREARVPVGSVHHLARRGQQIAERNEPVQDNRAMEVAALLGDGLTHEQVASELQMPVREVQRLAAMVAA